MTEFVKKKKKYTIVSTINPFVRKTNIYIYASSSPCPNADV